MHRDRVVALVAFVAVIVLGVLDGLLLAMLVSFVMLLKNMARAQVSTLGRLAGSHDYVDMRRHPEAQAVPGVLIVRPEQALFFGNADTVLGAIWTLVQQSRTSGLRAVSGSSLLHRWKSCRCWFAPGLACR